MINSSNDIQKLFYINVICIINNFRRKYYKRMTNLLISLNLPWKNDLTDISVSDGGKNFYIILYYIILINFILFYIRINNIFSVIVYNFFLTFNKLFNAWTVFQFWQEKKTEEIYFEFLFLASGFIQKLKRHFQIKKTNGK